MDKKNKAIQKIEFKGWSRREFLMYSMQLGLFSQVWSTQVANAKSAYNIAFWRLAVSNTILRVSEMSTAIAVGGTSEGLLGVSEVNISAALGAGDGILGVSEVSVSVAVSSS